MFFSCVFSRIKHCSWSRLCSDLIAVQLLGSAVRCVIESIVHTNSGKHQRRGNNTRWRHPEISRTLEKLGMFFRNSSLDSSWSQEGDKRLWGKGERQVLRPQILSPMMHLPRPHGIGQPVTSLTCDWLVGPIPSLSLLPVQPHQIYLRLTIRLITFDWPFGSGS